MVRSVPADQDPADKATEGWLHGRLAQQGFQAFETRPQERAILLVENVADIIINRNSAEGWASALLHSC